jgi:hypothetical protein
MLTIDEMLLGEVSMWNGMLYGARVDTMSVAVVFYGAPYGKAGPAEIVRAAGVDGAASIRC